MGKLPKIAVAILTFMVMVLSSGYSIHRMTCLMSGMERFALAPIEDCCPEEMPLENSISPICCTFGELALDLTLVDVPAKDMPVVAYVLPQTFSAIFTQPKSNCTAFPQNHSPPLPAGNELLPLIQQWLI